jgi:TatA/E family protein of Tat protein translocase
MLMTHSSTPSAYRAVWSGCYLRWYIERMGSIGGPELIIGLIIVALLFGSRLPKLARNLGQATNEFKKGQASANKDDAPKSDTPPSSN